MKKSVKWVGGVVLGVVVLLLVGVLVVYARLNGIVERTVETQATQQLNLKTELSGANVSLFGGNLKLDGLTIASPQGFAAPHMFSLGQADVSVKVGELRGDPVHVAQVTLNKPRLVIEQVGMGEFNFKKAMDLMPKSDPAPVDNKEPLKVVINELTIREPVVVIRPGIQGLAPEITVPVPTITMKNIGTGDGSQNGAALKDVAMQVITVLAGQAANSDALPDQLKQLLNVNVGQLVAQFGPQLQKRIQTALPGPVGETVAKLLNDPNALMKNPGQVLQDQGGQLLQGVLGGGRSPTTQPATQPADAIRGAVEKQATDALKGLLGGGKK
jgi:hypothetical protein